MKSTPYGGKALGPNVSVHLYSISGDGLQENFLGQAEFFLGGRVRRLKRRE
jgi:hypothetical protein